MEFEFDPEKSEKNQQRRRIDFSEAQALRDDPDLMEIPAKTTDEQRFLVIGKIFEKYWSGLITYRGERVRISRPPVAAEEVDLYES